MQLPEEEKAGPPGTLPNEVLKYLGCEAERETITPLELEETTTQAKSIITDQTHRCLAK